MTVAAPTPRLVDVRVTADPDGWVVGPIWADVDRPHTGGILVRTAKDRDRLTAAYRAGVVHPDPVVRTDVNGQTYVCSRSTIGGRHLRADLARLGF